MSLPSVRSESGFTLVEGLVAALLLALVATAVMATMSTAERATYRAEQTQVASDVAQRELEKLRGLSYSQLALASTPVHVNGTDDPSYRVSGTRFDVDKDGDTEADEEMVLTSGGTVTPSTPYTSGDVSGTIRRYVVWRDDPQCKTPAGLDLLCPGLKDYKRVVVAVTIDSGAGSGVQRSVELQSDVINPTDSVGSNPNLPLLGTPTVAQQFWLADESCSTTGSSSHGTTILTSHAMHNTFGDSCGTGNKPDALTTTPPPILTPATDLHNDGNIDLATDLEPSPPTPATADAGLQFLAPGSGGCTFKPIGTNGYKQQHIWVSPRLTTAGVYALTGGSTLKLWTRTINDAVTSGNLCVYLFQRTELSVAGLVTSVTDTSLANANPSMAMWPTEWEELTVPLSFTGLGLPAVSTVLGTTYNQRLGVAIGVRSGSGPLEVNYDGVDLASRLEIETTTPIG